MEKNVCKCKNCKHYYNKCRCKSKRCKKKYSDTYNSKSSSSNSSNSSNSSHRNQSIKIKVDCNRGIDETVKPKQCIKFQETDYKDEFLKYLLTNKQTNINPSINNNLYQNNIKFISGVISPCFDNAYSHQTGCGYTAEFLHTSTSDQWIIKIEHNHVINFILSPIHNPNHNSNHYNAFIDSTSIEISANLKPRFLNRIVINVKEPLVGFSFLALCN